MPCLPARQHCNHVIRLCATQDGLEVCAMGQRSAVAPHQGALNARNVCSRGALSRRQQLSMKPVHARNQAQPSGNQISRIQVSSSSTIGQSHLAHAPLTHIRLPYPPPPPPPRPLPILRTRWHHSQTCHSTPSLGLITYPFPLRHRTTTVAALQAGIVGLPNVGKVRGSCGQLPGS